MMMTVPVSAASLDAQIKATKKNITHSLEDAEKDMLGIRYDVGAIYTTTEDIDEKDVADRFGGTWQEINSTFLWATDGTHDYYIDEDGDGKDDKTDTKINPLHRINGRGGQSRYSLIAGVGIDDKIMYFWTGESSAYVDNHDNIVLSGTAEAGDGAMSGIKITEKDSQDDLDTIMPPYTVVKVFERMS